MLEAEQRQAGDVFTPGVLAYGTELSQGRVHVQRVPEHDYVDHETKRTELIFLAFPITLTQFAALAMDYGTGKLVAALATIELDQDPTSRPRGNHQSRQARGRGPGWSERAPLVLSP